MLIRYLVDSYTIILMIIFVPNTVDNVNFIAMAIAPVIDYISKNIIKTYLILFTWIYLWWNFTLDCIVYWNCFLVY